MAPFDRSYTTFYWSAIVNIVQFLSYLTLNNIVTLKSGLEVTQVIQNGTIGKLGCGFLFAFHSITMALPCISSEVKPAILVASRRAGLSILATLCKQKFGGP